ncbi:MAG: AmmeMemoRadiSam system protein A [Pyrinomonadaceae bacterium]
MAHTSSLVFAGIAPHPPIMVPEVGREAIAEVRNSIDAMVEFTHRVISSKAETVIIISPHAPLEENVFIAYAGPQIYGNFARFRAPTVTVQAELDDDLLIEIANAAARQHLIVMKIDGFDLDHGTAVPLYFLQKNGWAGKVVALGYSYLSNEDHVRFGNCVRAAVEKLGRRAALIASGDLSHRLKPEAPAGYNSDAHLFDEEIVDAIRSCAMNRIVDIHPDLRRTAGECGYRSLLVAIGATQHLNANCNVISYEAPFGVGYLVAQLAKSEPPAVAGGQTLLRPADGSLDPVSSASSSDWGRAATAGDSESICALARRAIEVFIRTRTIIDSPDNLSDLFNTRAACFVSIKTRNGDLRGCIGTVEPVKETLAEEILANAISAATRDPRFPPVRADELPGLKYSVDVLSQAETCTMEDLDPKIYGVIVEDDSGFRRGLLLPNLAGVDTAEQQVEIAVRKADISPGANIKLFRFRADRYSE